LSEFLREKEYFELEDQPARTIPYTPRDETAKTQRTPTFTLAHQKVCFQKWMAANLRARYPVDDRLPVRPQFRFPVWALFRHAHLDEAHPAIARRTTRHATVLLPGSGFAEKRGSMINIKGRLQRLNRAVNAPGQARDDWEILGDLIQQLTGSNSIYLIEDVFRQIADAIAEMKGLSLGKISDQGLQLVEEGEEAPTASAPV
jgi:Molybdopterin oxidoreductase